METTTEQLYWITRLDSIQCAFTLLLVCSIFAAVAVAFVKFTRESLLYEKDNQKDGRGRKTTIVSIVCAIVSVIILTLTPSTKDAYVIYGVGGTIDYLKKNEAAQQLPDKAIKALDSWVEYMTVEPVDSTKNSK